MAPPNAFRPKGDGKFSSAMVQIIVEGVTFNVHKGFLKGTRFFDIHTPQASPALSPRASPTPSDQTLGPDNVHIKPEDGEEYATTNAPGSPSKTDEVKCTYELKGLIYEPKAFNVIIKYLYNEVPVTPLHRNEFCTLRKAYILALQYGMEDLQDNIIDCFRNFHTAYSVQFQDLIWFANRLGPQEYHICQIPIIRYLIDQITYEIFGGGYEKFVSNNTEFEVFLDNGKGPIKTELYKVLTRIARDEQPQDPAIGENRWRVRDVRQAAPGARDGSIHTTAEVIDLED